MKRPIRSSLVIVTATLLLAGGLAAFAQAHQRAGGPPHHGYGGPGGPGDGFGFLHRIADEVGLTDEQRAEVHGRVEQAMQGELGELLRQQQQKHRDLRQLIHDPSTEESAITDAVRLATADSERLALAQHRLSVSVFEVLTPEQREQALKLLAEQPLPMQRRMHRQDPTPEPEN